MPRNLICLVLAAVSCSWQLVFSTAGDSVNGAAWQQSLVTNRLSPTTRVPGSLTRGASQGLGPTESAQVQFRQQRSRKAIQEILSNSAIWGKDSSNLLAHLEIFERVGEKKIVVFPNRVLIDKPYKSDEAKETAERLKQAIAELRARPTALFNKLMKGAAGDQQQLGVQIVPFAEDESIRVAVGPLQLLVPDLRMATVTKQLGRPEKITDQLIQTEDDSRPQILTLYFYAGGRIVFAEAEIAPRPGFVNRVLIDVPAVIASIN